MSGAGRSYQHRGGEVTLLGQTIPEHFAGVARLFADREAVVARPQGLRLTYAELAARVDEVARGILAVGFGPGDRVGVWSANNLEWLLLQLATARVGVVLVNVNPAYRPPELEYAQPCASGARAAPEGPHRVGSRTPSSAGVARVNSV